MYELITKVIITAALAQLSLNMSDVTDCRPRRCRSRLERALKKVSHVDWRPISVWPKERMQFR